MPRHTQSNIGTESSQNSLRVRLPGNDIVRVHAPMHAHSKVVSDLFRQLQPRRIRIQLNVLSWAYLWLRQAINRRGNVGGVFRSNKLSRPLPSTHASVSTLLLRT